MTQSLLCQMLLDIVSHSVICSTGRKPLVPMSLVLALFLIYSALEVQSKWRESTVENIPLFFFFFLFPLFLVRAMLPATGKYFY